MKRCAIACLVLGAGLSACNNPMPMGEDMAGPPPAPDLSVTPPGPDLAGSPPDLTRTLSEQAKQGLAVSPVTIDTTGLSLDQQEQIGVGAYLVAATGCAGCHGSASGKFLAGGNAFGKVYARNLTPDPTTGLPNDIKSEADFVAAIQTGKDFRDAGKIMSVMPWVYYRWLSTYDIKAIYAYLQKIPAVSNAVPADTGGVTGTPTALPSAYIEGVMDRPLPADDGTESLNDARGLALQPLADPADIGTWTAADKAAYGRGAYLVATVGHCGACHTSNGGVERDPATGKIYTDVYLSGGHVYNEVATKKVARTMSSDLSGMMYGLTGSKGPMLSADDFVKELTMNVHVKDPNMAALGAPMPGNFKNLMADDLKAIFAYLSKLPRRTGAADKATQRYARYCAMDADCNAAAKETCNVATNECVGRACTADVDCDACQTCGGAKTCAAPAAASTCLTKGI